MSGKRAKGKNKRVKGRGFCFLLFILLPVFDGSLCAADRSGPSEGAGLDKTKYITVDEIVPGMDAYCLTVYKGTEIERFALDVLSVVRDISPGRDAILVQGTDKRFIHTGPVAGCSGSPVYIDGRLAGALAFGWSFSKDPLYGVTPIEEMLRVGEGGTDEKAEGQTGFGFDFSRPIDFTEIDRQINSSLGKPDSSLGTRLAVPLIVSGLPAEQYEQLAASVEPFGFMAVSGIGGGGSSPGTQETKLVRGASLAVPLVTGDITMTVIGTVTDVVGDKVYGFGHSFLGYGPINLPMATGKVHTVVSNVVRSFKFASALEIVGALITDESAAVRGQIGAKAQMIPLTIRVNRYNDPETRVYNCRVANNQMLTPLMLRSAVAGAALSLGKLPPDHTIEYKVDIGVDGAESITFENVSTGMGLTEMIKESTGSVAMLLNNPYKKVDIKSLDFDIRIVPKNVSSRIWSVDLSDSKVRAGGQLDVSIILESPLAEKKKYKYSLKIPETVPPGKYNLIVCGGYGYQQFLMKAAPYKFTPQNLQTLVGAMNNLLAIRRNKLYCLLVLPSGGVSVEAAELPDLPATKVLVLGDTKRTMRIQPYQH